MSEIETPFGEPESGAAREILPGVWMLSIPVPFPPGTQNAYVFEDVVDGRAGWTVVDPGLQAAEPFWRRVLRDELGALPVRRVIATHHHPDHIGAAGWMQSVLGAELWTTRTAWLFARMLQLDAWESPPQESAAFYVKLGFNYEMMERYEARARFNFSVTVAPLPLGFRRIAAGDRIAIGERRFRVEIGDGHAPEHAVLVSESDDLVLAGDQALPRISPNIGVYATEPDADPLGEWLESCGRLAETLSDARLVLPGHGPVFRGASRRLLAIAAEHEERLDRLAAHLSAERRAVDCFRTLFDRDIPPAAEGLAAVETAAHLNRLEAAGRARRELRDGVEYWRRV